MTPDHRHEHATAEDERRLFWAMLLTGGFMVVEAAGALVAGSLTLLADASHMLTDASALGLAWFAFRVSRRPADPRRSYGYHRFQVLAAFVNGIALVAIVAWILAEALHRLFQPTAVLGSTMLVIALLGLVVNAAALALLHESGSRSLNIRGAAAHVLGDFLGSIAATVAAGVILWTGWMPIDPLLSIAVALLILRSAWAIVRKSAHILLEGSPDWLDTALLQAELQAAVPAVRNIHHVHVWSLTSERPLLTLHAAIDQDADQVLVLHSIIRFLAENYGIGHATVQLESGPCPEAGHTNKPDTRH